MNIDIEQRRKEKNLTQQQLADLCGSKQNNISRYEKGHRTPSLRDAAALAKALDCSIDDLFKEDEEPEAEK